MARRNTIEIVIRATDRATKPVSRVMGVFGKFGQSIGRIADYVVGTLIANSIINIGRSIAELAGEALNAAADLQMFTVALETLVAREISRGQIVEETSTAIRHLTEKERLELDKLQVQYADLNKELEDVTGTYKDAIKQHGEQSTEALRASIRMRELEGSIGEVNSKMETLNSIEGSVVTSTKEMRVGVTTLEEALVPAKDKAQELLGTLREISIISPFEFEQVAQTYRVTLAFGATTDQAMDMTRAILDTGSALGLTSAMLDRTTYNLAQALVQGDFTMQNLRQLKLVGLDLAGILEEELGYSLQELRDNLESGQLTLEEVSEAFVKYTEKNFGGAAERMSRTFQGLRSTIKDLFFFTSADLLTPALEVVTDVLNRLFDIALKIVNSGVVTRIGEGLGRAARWALKPLDRVLDNLQGLFDIFRREGAGEAGAVFAGLLVPAGPLHDIIVGIGRAIGTVIEKVLLVVQHFQGLVDIFKTEGFGAAAKTFLGMIFPPDVKDQILAFFDSLKEPIQTAIEEISGVLEDKGPIIKDAFDTIVEALGGTASEGLNFSELIPAIIGAISSLAQMFINFAAFAAPLVAQAIVWITENWDGIVGAIQTVIDIFTVVYNWFSTNWPTIAAIVMTAVTVIIAVFGALRDFIMGTLWPNIQQAFNSLTAILASVGLTWRDVFNGILAFIGTFYSILATVVLAIIAVILGIINGIATMVNAVRPWLQMFFSSVSMIFQSVRGIITAFIGLWTNLFQGDFVMALMFAVAYFQQWFILIGSIFTAIVSFVMIFVSQITGFISGLVQGIIQFFTDLYNRLVGGSIVPEMLAQIVEVFRSGLNDVLSAISKFISDAIAALKGAISKFVSIGKDIVSGLVKGIKSKADDVANALKGIIKSGIDKAKSALGISSPSQLMAEMIGMPMAQGIAQGILGSGGLISGALQNVTSPGGGTSITNITEYNIPQNITMQGGSPNEIMANYRSVMNLIGD